MTILGATSPPRFPIGHSDFRELRQAGLTYVDKTLWIAEVLRNPAKVLLVPRPRRFGKTLNMTTLRYFVERSDEDRSELFADTAVWSAEGGLFRAHFQRYPVVYLSFKDIKEPTWQVCAERLVRLLAQTVSDVQRLVPQQQQPSSDELRIAELQDPTGSLSSYTDMLRDVSVWLHRVTGERTVILVDEYDAPLHAAWQHGYWDEAVTFFRNFLSAGLKDNPHLFRGVLTGILKVAEEGVFSGLNHLETASILDDALTDSFGFTEADVAELAAYARRDGDLPTLRAWYNGYVVGDLNRQTVYNPWSVLSYLKSPSSGPRPFWKNTSDNALIRDLLIQHAAAVGPAVETLLQGGSLQRVVDENVALQQLYTSPGAVLGLLLFSGYLTTAAVEATDNGTLATLRIPNREVRTIFADTFLHWLAAGTEVSSEDNLDALAQALLHGDVDEFTAILQARLLAALSYHDVGTRTVEAVYQAFLLGMLVHLQETHRVQSNREAGTGRADILVVPHSPGPGAVLELKRVVGEETPEQALQRAVAQLLDRDYASEVRASGATAVHQFAVVFDGKRCWVRKLAPLVP